MSDDPFEIPAFLLLSQEQRNASWKGRKLTNANAPESKKHRWGIPQSMEPAGWKLLREHDAKAEDKKRERLAALKAWKEANKPCTPVNQKRPSTRA